ncbi:MAG: class I mannose-6-phosphate isomerase [Anaerolineae bacterium]|nr:class I mannose-6-phosphate isomerase [Anaerolineae bacterium]NUQ06514.1 class I mannose-6-phosphate isomerase [Anaerolineae bacterium]
MDANALYPFLLDPSLHVIVWGGRKLETRLEKSLPTDQPYGEAWELHDSAVVATGALAGQTVADLVRTYGTALIGEGSDPADGMPLLIKFLDANDWLSVQVHPNDAQAAALEGQPRGKTEAWYVVDAAPGARLINGLKPGTTREGLADAIRQDRVRDVVQFIDVQVGDGLFMPAGTVHALGPGLLIYEVQQSSSTTYRLYDWGRMGLDGKPRPLHIDKGTQVADPDLRPAVTRGGESICIFESPYFCTFRHILHEDVVALFTGGCFQAITVLEGALRIDTAAGSLDVPRGRTAFIPACIPSFSLSGAGTALRSWQPARRL